MQYRNAPDQDTKLSHAMMLFKRPISDVHTAKIESNFNRLKLIDQFFND